MLVSAGIIVADLFQIWERKRLAKYEPFDAMLEILEIYNVKFRDVNLEMFFLAELSHFRYYKVADFETLCFQCIDFSEMKDLEEEFVYTERKVNRIKCIGEPLWKKGLNNMQSWQDYRRYKR